MANSKLFTYVEALFAVIVWGASFIATNPILNDTFLQTFKDHLLENLRVCLLERLMADEIDRRQKSNLTRAKSFRQQLEKTLINPGKSSSSSLQFVVSEKLMTSAPGN